MDGNREDESAQSRKRPNMFYARHEATNPNMRAPSERAFALFACASSFGARTDAWLGATTL